MRDSVRQLVSGVVTALLLAVTSVACGGDFVTYYHSDVVGSPVAATDEQGRLMWRSQYRPYGGRIQSATDVAASANTSRWYGAYVDEGDGALIYMGGRYYDPSIGRFMGTDAQGFHIANVQSFGRYTYANNNPFSFKDPDGELPILVGVAVYGAGKAALENIAIQTAELGLGLRDEFSLSELAVDAAVGGISGGQASTVKNGARAVRIAEGVAKQAKQTERIAQNVVAKGEVTVIGRVKDLQNLKQGEKSLLDRLPNQGNPKANWKQNSGVLRQEMNKRQPIRDASPDDMDGPFLNAERNLLEDRGWTFDSTTNYWNPPAR